MSITVYIVDAKTIEYDFSPDKLYQQLLFMLSDEIYVYKFLVTY